MEGESRKEGKVVYGFKFILRKGVIHSGGTTKSKHGVEWLWAGQEWAHAETSGRAA